MTLARRPPADGALQLQLLGDFALLDHGRSVDVGAGARRLLAFLALAGRPAGRGPVAGALWQHAGSSRAAANLRSVLARLPRPSGQCLVSADGRYLSLPPGIELDVAVAARHIEALREDGRTGPGPRELPALLAGDLLPQWDEDWVVLERERHRQRRLHALERQAHLLAQVGRYDEALSAALTAVAGEPLRESAHRTVVEIHLAEGNAAEALRQFEAYRVLVRRELGIAPSAAIRTLVAPLLGRPVEVAPPR